VISSPAVAPDSHKGEGHYATLAQATASALASLAVEPELASEVIADIGHVHLKVSDLERGISFYRDLIGMQLKSVHEGAAFLAFGGYHHHLGLNTWRSRSGPPPPPEATGLYHFAVRYADRRDLAATLKRLLDAGIPIDSSSDCGGQADSIYLRDPDENGLELTWDRPLDKRPNPPQADDRPLDLDELLRELA
jgi:catechol 2,3-dioxygenase